MYNRFVGLKPALEVDPTEIQEVRMLSDKDHNERRDALYAMYTPMVNMVLDQMIAAYRPETWKKGSDCSHKYCCHCRWYAGPEETGRAHYGDHPIRRRIEIELVVDGQCNPTGFKIWNHTNPGQCVYTGLGQTELARGINTVLE